MSDVEEEEEEEAVYDITTCPWSSAPEVVLLRHTVVYRDWILEVGGRDSDRLSTRSV